MSAYIQRLNQIEREVKDFIGYVLWNATPYQNLHFVVDDALALLKEIKFLKKEHYFGIKKY